MADKVKIHPGFFLMAALAILLLPIRWLAAMLLAALVHEAFHCIAVRLCGGEILSISIGTLGAKIDAAPLSPHKAALCALAGPVGSFLMVLTAEHYPEAAIFGLIQGAYNLLPIYPLDGGRILRHLCQESICFGIRIFTVVLLTGLDLCVMTYNREIGLLLLLLLLLPSLQRKISCKDVR